MPIITIAAYRDRCTNWRGEIESNGDLNISSFDDAEKAADWLSKFQLFNAFEGKTYEYNEYEFDIIIDGVAYDCSKRLGIAETVISDKDTTIYDEHQKLADQIEARATEITKPEIDAKRRAEAAAAAILAERREAEETAHARRQYEALRSRFEGK